MGMPHVFLPFLQRGATSVTSCLLPWAKKTFQDEANSKWKQNVSIVSFKSWPQLEREA